mmetsp:Transcript_3080/g.11832  ORF Transcript_3080/g.11832 Transcript_3080/m.11832 type:complete len:105 (+) Transcript_3080:2332-2646(+)
MVSKTQAFTILTSLTIYFICRRNTLCTYPFRISQSIRSRHFCEFHTAWKIHARMNKERMNSPMRSPAHAHEMDNFFELEFTVRSSPICVVSSVILSPNTSELPR